MMDNDSVSWNMESYNVSENITFPVDVTHVSTKLYMSFIYVAITIVGLIGNIAVCIVVVKNKLMHTATNYYLCSMAVSDLLLLVTGIPHEMFILWVGRPYVFGFYFCVLRGLAAETSTNATVLTITAFTIERYIGICHPLRSQVTSHLTRVVRYTIVIWIVAFVCACPQAYQYGITPVGDCNVVNELSHTFEVSTILFFIFPMTLITVLYIKIGLELQKSQQLARKASSSIRSTQNAIVSSQRSCSVIKMLVAVVVAFFLCFAPFHAQRLVAMHGNSQSKFQVKIYIFLTNISGVCFYLSTCVNPVLYHTMSRRFRQTFKATLRKCFCSNSTFRKKNALRTGTNNSEIGDDYSDSKTNMVPESKSQTRPVSHRNHSESKHGVQQHRRELIEYPKKKMFKEPEFNSSFHTWV